MLARILLVTDDLALRGRLRSLAEGPDAIVTELGSAPADWLEEPGLPECDLVVADRAALSADVAAAVRAVRGLPGRPELVVVSGPEDSGERAGLLAAGCMAVVRGELDDRTLENELDALIAKRRQAAMHLREAEHVAELFRLGDFVSLSPEMRKLMKVAHRLSQSDSTVLILGETGVGKERLARAIHSESHRSGGPFVVINCGAIPESLLESELFGHEKGAFTGAIRAHRGHFELAHRGTIFLDEIGELPLHLQVKLLHVLQDRAIQRIGGEAPLHVDVRVMAATNRDLLTELDEKRFRPDLYYRLSVVTLEIPPLRERREDIPTLVESYLTDFRTQMPSTARRVSPEAMRALTDYAWPGNVRELINVVERAVLLCDGESITGEDLPENIAGAVAPNAQSALVLMAAEPLGVLDASWLTKTLGEARRAWLTAFERAYLSGLLRETRGGIADTAVRAGIDPRSLYTKMKQHGLRKEDFRS